MRMTAQKLCSNHCTLHVSSRAPRRTPPVHQRQPSDRQHRSPVEDTHIACRDGPTSDSADGAPAEEPTTAAVSPDAGHEELLRAAEALQRRFQEVSIPSVCFNCTGKVRLGTQCQVCGHHTMNDDALQASCIADPNSTANSPTANVLLSWDPTFDQHAMPVQSKQDFELGSYRTFIHPERPERAGAIVRLLQETGLAAHVRRVPCREAEVEELLAVHSLRYVEALKAASQLAADKNKLFLIGEEGYLLACSWQLFRVAAGAAAELAAMLVRGEGDGAAAVLRPPGHLAHKDGTGGWCFVNNVAVAVRAGQKAGAARVAVVDWGVHHGQGTQEIFVEDPSVLTISLHRHEGGTFFPGTGAAEEVGVGRGIGYNINIPWDTHGLADSDYEAAFRHVVLPALRDFEPQLVVVAGGFDSAEGDPVGAMQLLPEGYAMLTRALHDIAPTLLILEGGYNLRATADAFHECVHAMVEPTTAPALPADPKQASTPTRTGLLGISRALGALSKYWPSMRALTFEDLMIEYDLLGALQMLYQVLDKRRAPSLK